MYANLLDSYKNVGIFRENMGSNRKLCQHGHSHQTAANVLYTKTNNCAIYKTKGKDNYRLFTNHTMTSSAVPMIHKHQHITFSKLLAYTICISTLKRHHKTYLFHTAFNITRTETLNASGFFFDFGAI